MIWLAENFAFMMLIVAMVVIFYMGWVGHAADLKGKKTFCVRCRHCGGGYSCNSPRNKEVDIVTGDKRRRYVHARDVRAARDMCGPTADWFERIRP